MRQLIGRRMLVSFPLLLVVSMIVFVLEWLIPGNAAATLAGLNATPAQIENLRQQLHLDEPVYAQYWHWLSGVFRGTLGVSPLNGESVASAMATRLPVTLSLVVAATLLSLVVGVALGIVSSHGGRIGRGVANTLALVGFAVPSFWLGLLLIMIFSVTFPWFPPGGYIAFSSSPRAWAQLLVLPVCALAAHGITVVAKQTREAMLDVNSRDFIRNLRANGFPERSVVFKHALRTASLPVITVSGLLFITSLGGSVVIEQVFQLPGLGSLAVTATSNHDVPMIQGVAVYFTVLVIVVNLLMDIIYGWLNPKVRTR